MLPEDEKAKNQKKRKRYEDDPRYDTLKQLRIDLMVAFGDLVGNDSKKWDD